MINTNYLVVGLLVLLAGQCFIGTDAQASSTKKPLNILVMLSDDQRWDEFGLVQREQGDMARFPFLQTPRLDALAAQGMRFRNAFVTTSLCSPSRSAILTGQYNHTNGMINNATPFRASTSWATELQDKGYTTAIIGKWHHGNQRDRPGFDFVNSYVDQGNYLDTPFIVDGRGIKTEGYVDAVTVDFAIKFLEQRDEKPFAMLVGFKAVHQPFLPMDEYAQHYAGEVIRPAPNLNSVAPWRSDKPVVPVLPDGSYTKVLQTVSGLDQNVGRLLDALDRLDLAENTLVIFTSDNGYYFGEHGLVDKRSAYEESIRVPMLVRLPGVIEAGTVSDEMVLNIDLAPTILDLAVDEVPAEMQGMSMQPLFGADTASTTSWRTAFLYEYWQLTEKDPESLVSTSPTILAARTASYKLVTYPGQEQWTELFSLAADPYETRNIAGSPGSKQIQDEMQTVLRQLLDETDYDEEARLRRASLAKLNNTARDYLTRVSDYLRTW